MTRIMVDAELRGKLGDLSEPLDLCDESGRVIGRVLPVTTALPPGYSEPPLSEEEWKRREQEPGYSIEEALVRVERP
ncbi:MAG TPA: hypothetical protein VF306_17750 [Pirellulales bacterium]